MKLDTGLDEGRLYAVAGDLFFFVGIGGGPAKAEARSAGDNVTG